MKHRQTTKVYIASVEALDAPELYAAAYCIVSPARREKTDRLHFPKDRKLSLGAELLFRYALRQNAQNFSRKTAACPDFRSEKNSILPADCAAFRAGSELPLIYGDCGKPALAGGGLFFNLSHAGSYAMCALSDGEVGCDLEEIRRADTAIAERFFSEEENDDIRAALTEEEQKKCFTRIWTRRESYGKLLGKGLITDDRSGESGSRFPALPKEPEVYFTEYDALPDYAVCICTAMPGPTDFVECRMEDVLKSML